MNGGYERLLRRLVFSVVGLAALAIFGRAQAAETTSALASEPKASTASKESAAAVGKHEPTPAKGPRPVAMESRPGETVASRGEDDGIAARGAVAPETAPPASEPAGAAPLSAPVESDQSLKPIADPMEATDIAIEPASLKGVTPGETKLDEIAAAWGPPKEIRKSDASQVHMYSIAPFDRIEVSFFKEKCTAIVVRLQKAFPAEILAKQLELDRIRPVFVSDELGEVLGQAYPERGVLFNFVPSDVPRKASMRVSEIVLEPITAEPFVLRAELTLDVNAQAALRDAEAAVELDPKNARAQWLRARLLSAAGRQEKAESAATAAVALDPEDAHYRVARAQILAQAGKLSEAVAEAKKAVELGKSMPHVRARAICVLGDLAASGPKPDFGRAFSLHESAVKAAGALAEEIHPAVRVAAKEAMLDAYLGAAHDIAWGEYSDKEKSVKLWLERASATAEDLIAKEGASQEIRFRVATRALAACVGMRGALDPAPWVKLATENGQALIDASRDAVRRGRFEWELGSALYDAMQVNQLRRDGDATAKVGKLAVEHIEAAAEQRPSPASAYLLGRLYFRLGALDATRTKNHAAAVEWFDKALVQLAKPMPPEVAGDNARQGESLVIMGVSYWEVGQRERAVDLTARGVTRLEQAVKQGVLAESSLAIPYGNLAAMHQQLGKSEDAGRYQKMAAKAKGTTIK